MLTSHANGVNEKPLPLKKDRRAQQTFSDEIIFPIPETNSCIPDDGDGR